MRSPMSAFGAAGIPLDEVIDVYARLEEATR
jgi:hypothetical protein